MANNLALRIAKLEAGRAAKGVSLPLLVYSITDKNGFNCGQIKVSGAKFGQYREPTPEETALFKSMGAYGPTA